MTVPAGGGGSSASPTAPPPAPKIQRNLDIWNPGGHPDVLRRAAAAWRQLGASLRTMEHELDGAVKGVRGAWAGQASDAFQQYWSGKFSGSISQGAASCDQVASTLEQIAQQIESTNQQVHELYIAIGATVATGLALTVITLGFSDAAAAAAGTAEAAEAASIVARLIAFLEAMAPLFARAAGEIAVQWGRAFLVNLAFTAGEKAVFNRNHDPLSGWTIGDVAHSMIGADLGLSFSAGGSIAAGRIGTLGRLAEDHPFAWGAAKNFPAGALGAGANDTLDNALAGRPLFSPQTLLDMGLGGTVAAGAGGLGEWGSGRLGGSETTVTTARPGLVVPQGSGVVRVTPGGIAVVAAPDGTFTGKGGLLGVSGPRGVRLTPGGPTYDFQADPARGGLLLPVGTRPSGIVVVSGEPPGWRTTASGLSVPGGNRLASGLVLPPGVHASTRTVVSGGALRHVPPGLIGLGIEAPANAVGGAATAPAMTPPPMPPAPVHHPAAPIPAAPGNAPVARPHAHAAPPPPPAPVPVAGGGAYTVRHGDTLSSIARRAYGDPSMWRVIYRANAQVLASPDLLHSGQTLLIPSVARPAA